MRSLMIALAATLLGSVAYAQNDLVERSTLSRVFPFQRPESPLAYAEAFEVATEGCLAPSERRMYIASFKLAAVQANENHRQVLVMVAKHWHRKGIINPIGARYESMPAGDHSLQDSELWSLYRQVLAEQGLVKPTSHIPKSHPDEVWDLLNESRGANVQ